MEKFYLITIQYTRNMAIKRKGSDKKVYIAVILLAVLIAATAVIIYAMQPGPVQVAVGVHAGDTFSYSITGISVFTGLDAVETPGFQRYNQTDVFKITITDQNASSVSFDTIWRFKNGTEIPGKQTIDLSNGLKSDANDFWAIYAAHLKVGDLLRPTGFEGLKVNFLDSKVYASGTRERNFWFIENQFFDINDPTRNTLRDDYTGVYFDKQTGMLETLTSITNYNNPLKTETIIWKLVDTSVWAV
jgi:hypothetical protein